MTRIHRSGLGKAAFGKAATVRKTLLLAASKNAVFGTVGVGQICIRETVGLRMLLVLAWSVHGLLPFFKEPEEVGERIAFVLRVEQDDIGSRLRTGNAVLGGYPILKSA